MIVLATAALLLIQSVFAIIIVPDGNIQSNTKVNFHVVNGFDDSPVRIQVHDAQGNILSSSDGVTGSPISLYIPPHTSQPTYLVAKKLSINASTTQPLIFGSN